MPATSPVDVSRKKRVGVFGWGVVAPGASNVGALSALLRRAETALSQSPHAGLGHGLFAVGEPDFRFDDYAPWIAARHGDTYVARLRAKMGNNVLFALGATVQALSCDARLEPLVRELDAQVHVYVGSGLGDLPESYRAIRDFDRASRAWNRFWADGARCAARRHFDETGAPPAGAEVPENPFALPLDSDARFEALAVWDGFWAAHSDELRAFTRRYREVELLDADDDDHEKAHLNAIRKRKRAHRKMVDEVGCPPPPWTAVSPNLLWNIQNAPAAQITMLLGIHGEAWAPVAACSTFGVALKCGRDAILSGSAKIAIVGTTDPRPDPALAAAFHEARVMPATGEANYPFTSLRGTSVSGGACVWVLGDADYLEAHGLRAVGGYVDAVAISSDAEHIITPSKSGPKRAIVRAYAEAGIVPSDVAQVDLHATGTPGDLNELALVDAFLGEKTLITARKGVLGHGMANCGGWELTALALSLKERAALATGISPEDIHARVPLHRKPFIVTDEAPLSPGYGVKLMLGIGGVTACVVLRPSSVEPKGA